MFSRTSAASRLDFVTSFPAQPQSLMSATENIKVHNLHFPVRRDLLTIRALDLMVGCTCDLLRFFGSKPASYLFPRPSPLRPWAKLERIPAGGLSSGVS